MTRLTPICCFVAMLTCIHACSAQETGSQSFRLHIPGLISINAVNDTATIVHDLSESDQQFSWQDWTVRNQNRAGAVVTFQTDQAFTNQDFPTSKRNVRIDLRKKASPGWKISQKNDQTDYQSGDESAIVRAESNRPGAANFRLRVTFIEETLDTLKAGDYEITVIGTLIPK
jgi:hypothetical protein